MLTPNSKRQLQQIIPFGIVSCVFGIIYAFLEKGILGDSSIYPSTTNPYVYKPLFTAGISFVVGLVMGTIEVLVLSRWFSKLSFLKKMVAKTGVYFLVITLSTISLITIGGSYQAGVGIFNAEVWEGNVRFISSFAFWSIQIYITVGITLSLFYLEVGDKIGQGALIHFFTGRYHQAIEEERIFMFLDMKSSTTIAEKLGHITYFKMLREYYSDLSAPILRNGGEIYQYVGDEVVVSWRVGRRRPGNQCIDCFFAMKAALKSQEGEYKERFGVVPTFKAGIHMGKVTTGEIGVLKKEVVFSGDVLNATARIQGLCNEYKVDLLTSEKLVDSLELGPGYEIRTFGEATLRGRNEAIKLCTIEKVGE